MDPATTVLCIFTAHLAGTTAGQALALFQFERSLAPTPVPTPPRDDTAICYAKIAAKQRGEHIAG